MVCSLIELPLLELVSAMGPGVKSAACCAAAAKAGVLAAAGLGIGGAFTLPFVVVPVAIVLLWLEFGTASKVIRLVFRAETPSLVAATQEQG